MANGVVNVHRDALSLKVNYKCVGCSVMATGLLAANYMYLRIILGERVCVLYNSFFRIRCNAMNSYNCNVSIRIQSCI